jgi:hypothetical protein
LLAEEVGVHTGVTYAKKSPAEAAVAMVAAKHQELAMLRHAVLAITDFARLFGCIGKSCFFNKKLPT